MNKTDMYDYSKAPRSPNLDNKKVKKIDLVFIQTNAFIQGYAKAMEHAGIGSDILGKLGRKFNVGIATEEFKKKLEAKK